jgi:hypothetical protein
MGVKSTAPCRLMGRSCLRDQIYVRGQFHASAALSCDKSPSFLYNMSWVELDTCGTGWK